jgi:phospholipid/cholesterol/gamma-HCH transport system permease protein
MMPVLVMYTAFVGMMGSFIDVNLNEDTSLTTFFDNAFSSITFLDFFTTITKALIFGFTIGIVGCYKGYNATQGTQGVGRAANTSVVVSMFLIFFEEVLIVQIATWLRTP